MHARYATHALDFTSITHNNDHHETSTMQYTATTMTLHIQALLQGNEYLSVDELCQLKLDGLGAGSESTCCSSARTSPFLNLY
jgi:hypothetical protein